MVKSGQISSQQAKDVFALILEEEKTPQDIVKEKGMEQISDETALLKMVEEVVANNPDSVSDYKAGRDRAVKYLMGQIMKASRGQANPQIVNQILLDVLKKY